MKNLFLTITIILVHFSISAQEWNNEVSGQLTTNDKVGIGTDSPENNLEIKSSSKSSYPLSIENSANSNNLFSIYEGASGGANLYLSDAEGIQKVKFGVGSESYLMGGNVGIGTTDPNSNLEIKSSSKSSYPLSIENSANSNNLFSIYEGASGGANLYLSDAEGIQKVKFGVGSESYLMGGNVGIGTTDPNSNLEIKSSSKSSYPLSIENSANSNNLFSIYEGASGGANLYLSDAEGIQKVKFGVGSESYLMGGNVGIGTTDPQNKLSVAGTIWAEEVKVSLNDGADWVFEDNYELKTLEEVEDFIQTNKHLPDVPSAEEFRQNDLNVAEMDNTLLQKIEELTLYLIEQNKENKNQQALIESQSEMIQELRKEVTELKNDR